MASGGGDDVRIVSRRMLRPDSPTASSTLGLETCILHLTPWDLRAITIDYIHKGVLLPNPPHTAGGPATGQQHAVVKRLASSFARALGRFYPFAGRLVVDDGGASTSPRPSLTVSLRCSDEGAEFVHAAAPGVTVAEVAAPLYIPRVVRSFFSLDGLLGADAVAGSRPVLAAQVTELADGVFVAMSLNHAVADGTTFWHLFNTWSEISRLQSNGQDMGLISTPSPVLERWFVDGCPVPIPLPFGKLEDIVGQRIEYLPVQECFLHFSAESVKKLKAKANTEVAGTAMASATISSLQAVLGHLWLAVCRARGLAPDQGTTYILLVGCRGRIDGLPAAYAGNATTRATAESPAGEILDKGLGWAGLLLNRAVASFDEASTKEALASWPRNPTFTRLPTCHARTTLCAGSSPRFDVYGYDFGWGRPVTVRSGPENKVDGKVTVYEGGGGGGSMALEVCLAPEALARLVADKEFMAAVTTATAL